MPDRPADARSSFPALAGIAVIAAYSAFFLHAESQAEVLGLVALAGAGVAALARLGWSERVRESLAEYPAQSRAATAVARRDPRAFLPRALSDADAGFLAALHRGLPRAHGAVRLCRRGEFRRRRLLRHRRVYLRSVGGPSVASARRARRRRHGGARGVVADSAGAEHARPLRSD